MTRNRKLTRIGVIFGSSPFNPEILTRVFLEYRSPSSSSHSIILFEKIVDKIDAELFSLGDLNCNLLSNTPNPIVKPNPNTSGVFFKNYSLSLTITKPTRITNTSQTLIDLCITNNSDIEKSSSVLCTG